MGFLYKTRERFVREMSCERYVVRDVLREMCREVCVARDFCEEYQQGMRCKKCVARDMLRGVF